MNNLGFQVEIIKTNRKKSASIQLIDGQVRVRAPRTLSDKRINDLIKKRSPWIKEKLEAYSNKLRVVEKKYITPINAPSSEVMKLIVSGGVAEFNKIDKQ